MPETCISTGIASAARNYEPIGGEIGRSDFVAGPSFVSEIDRRHMHLSDCTLGVVGVGNIGAEICRRARAFGMTVIGVDPRCREVPGAVPEVWPTERLFDLLGQSDFVVIAAPHTPETYKLFRRDKFEAMKPTAYFINIGRGAIVVLADLVAALQAGRIAGAALDVFETEPLPVDSPLWAMPNAIITPHVAAASTHIADAIWRRCSKTSVSSLPVKLRRQWSTSGNGTEGRDSRRQTI